MICLLGVYIILSSLRDNIVFFYPPSEIHKIKHNSKARIGGLVKKDSVITGEDGEISFTLVDFTDEIIVKYKGLLPALFRDGQGIVAEGILNPDKIFIATKLLAKHDENYMPPGLSSKIKLGEEK